MNAIDQLRDLATVRGAEVRDRGNGHIQIVGALLVNYYPDSKRRSAYVAGTTSGRNYVTPEQAVAMAFEAPKPVPIAQKDQRGGHSRKLRKRLLRKSNRCHWCGKELTIDTATLEHKIPLHRGGLDNSNNRTLACEGCNRSRGHNMPELEVAR